MFKISAHGQHVGRRPVENDLAYKTKVVIVTRDFNSK